MNLKNIIKTNPTTEICFQPLQNKIMQTLNVPFQASELLEKLGYKLPSKQSPNYQAILKQQKKLILEIVQGSFPTTGDIEKLVFLLNDILQPATPFDATSAKQLKLYLYASTIKNSILRDTLLDLAKNNYEFTAYHLPQSNLRTCQWIQKINACFNKNGRLTKPDELQKLLTQLTVKPASATAQTSIRQKWDPIILLNQIKREEDKKSDESIIRKNMFLETIKKLIISLKDLFRK